MPDPNVVHAAGAVLWRPSSDGHGTVELALIHRPKYDDWSFPKGKRAEGEDDLETALREVREETGFDAEVGRELGESRYQHRGRDKIVRYWAMREDGGEFSPSDEVDRLEWTGPDEAAGLLTYDRDRELLRHFLRSHVMTNER